MNEKIQIERSNSEPCISNLASERGCEWKTVYTGMIKEDIYGCTIIFESNYPVESDLFSVRVGFTSALSGKIENGVGGDQVEKIIYKNIFENEKMFGNRKIEKFSKLVFLKDGNISIEMKIQRQFIYQKEPLKGTLHVYLKPK